MVAETGTSCARASRDSRTASGRLDCGAGKVGGPRISSGTTISLVIAATALLGLVAVGALVLVRRRPAPARDDRLVQALVHSVAAKAAAADGDAEEAMARVASATTILVASDALADRARMELARARVLELLGENVEPALDEAIRLLKAKRNVRAIRAVEAAGTSALV